MSKDINIFSYKKTLVDYVFQDVLFVWIHSLARQDIVLKDIIIIILVLLILVVNVKLDAAPV